MSSSPIDKTSKTLIAIVDDDEDDRDFISTALLDQKSSLEIRAFKGGGEFLHYINAAKILPELVITDIRMPLVNGFEVIDTVKSNSRTSHLPIVVLSTSGNDEDIKKAKDLGAAAYFIKPYTFDEYTEITTNIIMDLDAGLLGYSVNFIQVVAVLRRFFSGAGFNPGRLVAGS